MPMRVINGVYEVDTVTRNRDGTFAWAVRVGARARVGSAADEATAQAQADAARTALRQKLDGTTNARRAMGTR